MQKLDENFYIAGQLVAEDFSKAKELSFTIIINNRPDGEEPGILSVSEAKQLASDFNIEYLHLPMANGQPLPEDLIPSMQLALQQVKDKNGKILAHCRTGTRSSFLWGIIQLLEGNKTSDEVIAISSAAGINLTGFTPILKSIESS